DRARPRLHGRVAQACGAAVRRQYEAAWRHADGARRSAPGHRACGRAGAGADAARPCHRVRRQPHGDAWCPRGDRDRHRRHGSLARDADADLLAEEAKAHARHGRRQMRPRHRRQGHRALDHCQDRHQRRAGACDRVRRPRDPRAVAGGPPHALQSGDRGGRTGMVSPDETTFAYIKGRPFAPKGADFDRALAAWQQLPSDSDAAFDTEVSLDASQIAPVVTWGTSPEDTLPIDAAVPDPATVEDPDKAKQMQGALDYMGLAPRQKLTDIRVDRVFIGSCTNARIEDLRAAAAVLSGRKAKVPGLVSAGSTVVKHQAEQEGLDKIFIAAGLTWGESGCSMCLGINGDTVPSGERCAS